MRKGAQLGMAARECRCGTAPDEQLRSGVVELASFLLAETECYLLASRSRRAASKSAARSMSMVSGLSPFRSEAFTSPSVT